MRAARLTLLALAGAALTGALVTLVLALSVSTEPELGDAVHLRPPAHQPTSTPTPGTTRTPTPGTTSSPTPHSTDGAAPASHPPKNAGDDDDDDDDDLPDSDDAGDHDSDDD